MELFFGDLKNIQALALLIFLVNAVYSQPVRMFSCGKLYYRELYINSTSGGSENKLFVGAKNALFGLNLENINKSNCKSDVKNIKPTNTNCGKKNAEYNCQNHIRAIQPFPLSKGTKLYFCGTNAFDPTDYVINIDFQKPPEENDFFDDEKYSQAKCPFSPDSSDTSIWDENGSKNGFPDLYAGVERSLQTIMTVTIAIKNRNKKDPKRFTADSSWLNSPEFVGSFDIGNYVYFFFRELACKSCDDQVESRVARVCKNDGGGGANTPLNQVWTSFLKANLTCLKQPFQPGQSFRYFPYIQNIRMHPQNNEQFYGIFTAAKSKKNSSAVCSYNLKVIENALNGRLNAKTPVPNPRAGVCLNNTLKGLSKEDLYFIQRNIFVEKAIYAKNGEPIYYMDDHVFSNLIVDSVNIGKTNATILYVATIDGKIHKLVPFQNNDESKNLNLIGIFDGTYPEQVRAMAVSSKRKSLYVSSDTVIYQINIAICENDTCSSCVADPYCQWDINRKKCKPYESGDRSCPKGESSTDSEGTTDGIGIPRRRSGGSGHYIKGNKSLILFLLTIGYKGNSYVFALCIYFWIL